MRRFIILIIFPLLFCERTEEDIELTDLSGNEYRVSDFKGKIVLLDFWATWCPPCHMSIPEIISLHEKYSDRGLIVVGISLDRDYNTLKRYCEKKDIPYLILIGNQKITKRYDIKAIPTFFLLDRKGKVVYHQVGYLPEKFAEIDRKIGELIE